MASAFIERVGVATLSPASPEFPNLFSAYVGDPHTKTDSGWETPSGEVYGWRWTLGRSSAAFTPRSFADALPGFAGLCFPPSCGFAESCAHQKSSTRPGTSLLRLIVSYKRLKPPWERSRPPNCENEQAFLAVPPHARST